MVAQPFIATSDIINLVNINDDYLFLDKLSLTYYDNGGESLNIKIYIKDSTEDMKELNSGSVDLIITSPPYWNIIDYKHPKQLGKNLSYKQFLYYLKKNLLECMRVLKEDGLACFVIGDIRSSKYSSKKRPIIYSLHSDLIHFFTEEMDFDFFQHFIWEKFGVKKGEKEGIIYGSVCRDKSYKNYAVPPYLYNDLLMEHILVFRKPGLRTLPSLKDRQKEKENLIDKEKLQEWLRPVWRINSLRNAEHKAIFPEKLVERLIKMYSLKNDIVLDPFCGIGTTLKKAIELQRNAIGYEIKEDYILKLAKEYNLVKKENYYYRPHEKSKN